MEAPDFYKLYTDEKKFTLQPVFVSPATLATAPRNLVIDRLSGNVHLADPKLLADQDQTSFLTVFGLLGFIQLEAYEYMVLITDRTHLGRLATIHDIYKVAGFKVLPVSKTQNLSDAQLANDASYLSLLHAHLATCQLHYSTTFDMTHSLQRQAGLQSLLAKNDPATVGLTRWERADERFTWNFFLQSKLINHCKQHQHHSTQEKIEMSTFMLPVVNGFVEFKSTAINKQPVVFCLFSRRSRHRAGARYFCRGVDDLGNVSNFNETEQVVLIEKKSSEKAVAGELQAAWTVLSHVQTRGSIPVYWTQVTVVQKPPMLKVFENPATESSFRLHFANQKALYGPQIVINLIDKQKYEAPIGYAFTDQLESLDDAEIKYHAFDFHKECAHMRWDRVSILLDEVVAGLNQQGYFLATVDAQGQVANVQEEQKGVVRTNCMDCLDRTNVVQSVISRWILNQQLQQLGVLDAMKEERFDGTEEFELLFRNMWADHADVISRAYSGTGALKTEFTRTGKRTQAGVWSDAQNSALRFLKNNFMDGARQDGYDLFLGAIPDVRQYGQLYSADQRSLAIRVVPFSIFFALFLIPFKLFVAESIMSVKTILFELGCLALILYSIQFIIAHGDIYVSMPKLKPLELAPGDLKDALKGAAYTTARAEKKRAEVMSKKNK